MLCDRGRSHLLLRRKTSIENDSNRKRAHKRLFQNAFSGPTLSDVEQDKRELDAKKAIQIRCAPMGLAEGCDPFLGQEPRLDAGRSLFCHTEIKRNLEPLTCTGKTQSI